MLKPDWVAKAHLTYDFFSLSAVAESYARELVEILGFPFNYKYQNRDVFYDQRDLDRHAAALTARPKLIINQLDLIRNQVGSFLQASQRYGSRTTRSSFDEWYRAYRSFLPALGLVFGLEQALGQQLKPFLAPEQFYSIAFADETASAKEQRSLLGLATLNRRSQVFQRAVRRHLGEYAWLGNKMMTYTPFTETQVLERSGSTGSTALEKLATLDNNRRGLEKGLRAVRNQLAPEQWLVVTQYRDLLFLRTERADAVARSASLTRPLISAIARRLDFSPAELLRFSHREISQMLDRPDRQDPDDREQYSAEFVNGRLTVVWGSWGSTDERSDRPAEIRGTIACRGRATGRVRIVQDFENVSTFQRGEILVASYTNPNMVPAMEKAAAIVTNIGGLTSHAAIVARELGKPCIIGTEHATDVLHNGDLVEVDASGTLGLVRLKARRNF